MTLRDMKEKVYTLIEEYSEDSDTLTEDEDLSLKMNHVINQIQNELIRYKKILADKEINVTEGQKMYFADIDNMMYQLDLIRGVKYDVKNNKITFNENGTADIYYFKYPKTINADTPDTYKFELSNDLLEIMPYGVAADLLKSDVSSQYGAIYDTRYRNMLLNLDPRYSTGNIELTGGINL